jgi:AcrR family transcriptional regulator
MAMIGLAYFCNVPHNICIFIFVQDVTNMPRGRPRQYDENTALEAAMRLFWAQGYAGTSLDELARATGMNRPSLYNAFGNKKSIFRRAMARFSDRMGEHSLSQLHNHADLAEALKAYYYGALDVYFDAPEPLGCLYFCTAAPEASEHSDIRDEIMGAIRLLDDAFTQRFEQAQAEGQIPEDADPRALAALAQAIQHSLSIRARAGAGRKTLQIFAAQSVNLLLSRPSDAVTG